MSDLNFEYHPRAIAEAFEAYNWYLDQSLKVAERFWNELTRARTQVTAEPEAWTTYYHGTRCFHLRRFPYGLVYVERPGKIVGVAVCHFSRRPGYWLKRLNY